MKHKNKYRVVELNGRSDSEVISTEIIEILETRMKVCWYIRVQVKVPLTCFAPHASTGPWPSIHHLLPKNFQNSAD